MYKRQIIVLGYGHCVELQLPDVTTSWCGWRDVETWINTLIRVTAVTYCIDLSTHYPVVVDMRTHTTKQLYKKKDALNRICLLYTSLSEYYFSYFWLTYVCHRKKIYRHTHRHFSKNDFFSCFECSTIRICNNLEHYFFCHHHTSIALWNMEVKYRYGEPYMTSGF